MAGEHSTLNPKVEYRDVPGFPGYRAGGDGSVWSLWTKHARLRDKKGRITGQSVMTDTWRRRALVPNTDGYLMVRLSREGKTYSRMVNRLVLEVFVGPPPGPGYHAAHDNNVRTDNRVCNLFWKSPKANAADKRRHGTQPVGEDVLVSVLTENQVIEMRTRYFNGPPLELVGEVLKVLRLPE